MSGRRNRSVHRRGAIIVACATALATFGAGVAAAKPDPSKGLPQGSEVVDLDPADFTTDIDNPYWPMRPGNTWVYVERDPGGPVQDVVVEVLDETKLIANGVEARVVRDTVTEDGVPIEITDDWYAQDSVGNIWYLGEHVTNYEDGEVVDNEGSFEAGVDGAQAGIVMPARPKAGMTYRQEYYAGEAEDNGAVVTVGKEKVSVPFGFFDKRVLMTRDTSTIEPKVQELKFFAPGVGPLLSIHLDGPGGRAALVSFTEGTIATPRVGSPARPDRRPRAPGGVVGLGVFLLLTGRS